LIFGMPIEELVFFIVVPICGLLTYEAVGQVSAAEIKSERGRAACLNTPCLPCCDVAEVAAELVYVKSGIYIGNI
jgi:hypothetical protein